VLKKVKGVPEETRFRDFTQIQCELKINSIIVRKKYDNMYTCFSLALDMFLISRVFLWDTPKKKK